MFGINPKSKFSSTMQRMLYIFSVYQDLWPSIGKKLHKWILNLAWRAFFSNWKHFFFFPWYFQQYIGQSFCLLSSVFKGKLYCDKANLDEWVGFVALTNKDFMEVCFKNQCWGNSIKLSMVGLGEGKNQCPVMWRGSSDVPQAAKPQDSSCS